MTQECSNSFVIEGNNCPAPVINSFTPMSGNNYAHAHLCYLATICKSKISTAMIYQSLPAPTGPFEGGTAITVNGTDLGITFTDIQNATLTLGGVACTPTNTGYIPGRQFVCETINFVTEGGSKEFSLTIGSRVAIVMAGSFTAVDPTVSSVTPTFGFITGGTTVVVRGTKLDVGNQEDTRVSLEISGSKYACNIS